MPQFCFNQKSQVSPTSLVFKLVQLKIGCGWGEGGVEIFGIVDNLPQKQNVLKIIGCSFF